MSQFTFARQSDHNSSHDKQGVRHSISFLYLIISHSMTNSGWVTPISFFSRQFHHVSSLTNRGWVILQIFLPRSLIKSHNSMWVTTHVFICQAFTPCVIWSPGGGWHSILIFPGHLIIISSHLMQGVSVTQTFFLLPNSLITSHCIMNTDCKSHYLPTKQSYNYSSSYIQQTVGGIPIFFTIQCLWIMIITYLITKGSEWGCICF